MGKRGSIRAKLFFWEKVVVMGIKSVVFGHKWMYSGKVIVFGQNRLYWGEVVAFGQSGCIRSKVVVFW